MNAESILNEIGNREGWNDTTKLGILLEYIENQKSNDTFKDFLEEYAHLEDNIISCKRCGCDVNDGYCSDISCPFSEHTQECPAGWQGHPEVQVPSEFLPTHKSGDCTCGED